MKKRFLLGLSLLANIGFFWIFIWGDRGFIEAKGLEQELAVVDGWNDNLRKNNLALSREIALLQSDGKYIEQVVRKRLGYIRNNEIWYIFPDRRTLSEGMHEAKN